MPEHLQLSVPFVSRPINFPSSRPIDPKMLQHGVIQSYPIAWPLPGTTRLCVEYRNTNVVNDLYLIPRTGRSGGFRPSICPVATRTWECARRTSTEKKVFANLWNPYEASARWYAVVSPCDLPRKRNNPCQVLQWQVEAALLFSRLQATEPKKCRLLQRRIVFLGHVVSSEGISTGPAKISSACDCSTPKQVLAPLGLCSFYCRSTRKFANVAKSLYKLTGIGKQFMWTEACFDFPFHVQLQKIVYSLMWYDYNYCKVT